MQTLPTHRRKQASPFAQLVCTCALTLACSGCHLLDRAPLADVVSYSTRPSEGAEFDERAKALNEKGTRAFRLGHYDKAEAFFRDALAQDVSFGPAHNNLGQLYLARHQLYLAAWEFEYAANLMPELPHPIVGQGLAYETAEQLDQAELYYRQAHEQFPTNPLVLSSLVRVLIKQDSDPFEIGVLLDQLILHDDRQDWIEWAKELRMTRYGLDCGVCIDGYHELGAEEYRADPAKVDSNDTGSGRLLDGLMEFGPPEQIPAPTPSDLPQDGDTQPLELLMPQTGEAPVDSVKQVSHSQSHPWMLPEASTTRSAGSNQPQAIRFDAAADSIRKAIR
ncbi:MAG: tetratricopeptide repeat protein [Planctomycetota bacterium]